MLRLFYKTVVVYLLSCSLMLVSFNYAYAQSGAGPQSQSQTTTQTLKTTAISDDNLIATITMVIVGLLAGRLYKAKKTTDILLAAAGGTIFLAGDVIAMIKNNQAVKSLETQITRNDKGEIDQKQIQTLETLKKSYTEAKSTASMKQMLQMAAGGAFAAAGVTAFMMATTAAELEALCLLAADNALAASTGVLKICAAHTAKQKNHFDLGIEAKKAAFAADSLAESCATTPVGLAGCAPPLKVKAENFRLTSTKEGAASDVEKGLAADCKIELDACVKKIGNDKVDILKIIAEEQVLSPSGVALTKDLKDNEELKATVMQTAAVCMLYSKQMDVAENKSMACPIMATSKTTVENSGIANNILTEPLNSTGGTSAGGLVNIMFPKNFELQNPKKYTSSNYFEKALGLLFPSANASMMMSLLGLGTGFALKFVLAMYPQLANTLDLHLLIPKRRAIAWGILAALSLAASMATGAEIKKIEENLKKIDDILKPLNALASGVTVAEATVKKPVGPKDPATGANKILAINVPKGQQGSLSGGNTQAIDLNANAGGDVALPCMTGPDIKDCPSFSQQLNASPNIKGMPDYMQGQIDSIGKLTDGLNGQSRISAATLGEAQALANQQNALRLEMKKQQNALQRKLNEGRSLTDLELEGSKLATSMKAIVTNGLKANNISAKAMYASFGGSSSGSGTDVNSGASALKGLSSKGSASDIMGAFSGGDSSGSSGSGAMRGDRDAGSEEAARLAAEKKAAEEAAKHTNTTQGMDAYDLKNDITKDKDTSLFDLISNRYQKSYDKLFKKVK